MSKRLKGKHANEKEINHKKVFFCLFVIILIVVSILIVKNHQKNNNEDSENISESVTEKMPENQEQSNEIVDIDIPDNMDSFEVLGKIIIDKIELEKNILDKTTDSSLDISVTKFCGPNLNEVRKFLYYRT